MKAKERKSKEAIMKELACLGHLIRGSLVRTHRKCGKPNCACAQGKHLHPVCLLSTPVKGGGNKMTYVRKVEEEAVEAGIAAYNRAWEIVNALSALNVAEIKQGPGSLQGRRR